MDVIGESKTNCICGREMEDDSGQELVRERPKGGELGETRLSHRDGRIQMKGQMSLAIVKWVELGSVE